MIWGEGLRKRGFVLEWLFSESRDNPMVRRPKNIIVSVDREETLEQG